MAFDRTGADPGTRSGWPDATAETDGDADRDRFGKFQFFVEPAISTGNEGLLVNGWAVDPDRELRHLYLSCSRTGRVLGDLATHWARTPRPMSASAMSEP